MRIAIPTADFKHVFEGHFGDAPYYLIFDVNLPCIKFVEARKNEAAEIEEEEHEEMHGSVEKFRAVMKVIPDVDTIVAYAVGPNVARVKLKAKKGVVIVRETREISKVLDVLPEKLGFRVYSFDGEVFYEVIEVNGKKFEHAGFRDEQGRFGEALFSLVGPEKKSVRARVFIAVENRR